MKGKKGGNAKGQKSDLPEINEKYVNPSKIDESEGRIHEQLSSLNSLKNISLNYYNDLLKKESELVKYSLKNRLQAPNLMIKFSTKKIEKSSH